MSELIRRFPLIYDADSGEFTWALNAHPRFAGRVAGAMDSNGYILIQHKGKKYKAHRLAWEVACGPIPAGFQIDHINGIGSDNRIQNLRLATCSQNQMNCRRRSGTSSLYKGVGFHKVTGKWAAFIADGPKTKWLGVFEKERDAALAYNKAAIEIFGEFARLNSARELVP